MSEAKLEALGGGRFRLSGILDATTVSGLLKDSAALADGRQIQIDLGSVSESDSAGLALLLEWLRAARQRGQHIHFANVPAQIHALARISEVEQLIETNTVGG